MHTQPRSLPHASPNKHFTPLPSSHGAFTTAYAYRYPYPVSFRLPRTCGNCPIPSCPFFLPQSGELAARSDVVVTVEFSAIEKRLCEARLALEVLDVAELQGVAHSIPLPIKGEAYKIEIDVNFPQVGGGWGWGSTVTAGVCISSQLCRHGPTHVGGPTCCLQTTPLDLQHATSLT